MEKKIYRAIESAKNLGQAVDALKSMGFVGVNTTMSRSYKVGENKMVVYRIIFGYNGKRSFNAEVTKEIITTNRLKLNNYGK